MMMIIIIIIIKIIITMIIKEGDSGMHQIPRKHVFRLCLPLAGGNMYSGYVFISLDATCIQVMSSSLSRGNMYS